MARNPNIFGMRERERASKRALAGSSGISYDIFVWHSLRMLMNYHFVVFNILEIQIQNYSLVMFIMCTIYAWATAKMHHACEWVGRPQLRQWIWPGSPSNSVLLGAVRSRRGGYRQRLRSSGEGLRDGMWASEIRLWSHQEQTRYRIKGVSVAFYQEQRIVFEREGLSLHSEWSSYLRWAPWHS